MKNLLHSYFSFTSRERNGIIVLLVIIALITAFKVWMTFHEPAEVIIDNEELMSKLAAFESQSVMQDKAQDASSYVFSVEELYETPELFSFDPNTVTENELIQIGLNEKAARTLLNYRRKGGRFYDREDLKKIYGMTIEEYERIEPYVIIEKYKYEKPNERTNTGYSYGKIDLNRADSSALIRLRGIGPVLANRIIKYRALLGGYCNTEQLKEVYGISDSLFMNLRQFVYADSSGIKRINVNMAAEQHLSTHPYIGNYYAEGIIQYRQYVKKISGITELFNNNLIPENKQEILVYYLTF